MCMEDKCESSLKGRTAMRDTMSVMMSDSNLLLSASFFSGFEETLYSAIVQLETLTESLSLSLSTILIPSGLNRALSFWAVWMTDDYTSLYLFLD